MVALLVVRGVGVPAFADDDVPPTAPQPVPKVAPAGDAASGNALRAVGIRDLDDAVSSLGATTDVTTAASAAVSPSVWGLADFGSFLVVMDGVPWGGAFTPAVSRVNLSDVQSIEVQSAGAPVLYGTAAFAGIVHVSRYAPADTPSTLHASVGSFGSSSLGLTSALPALGSYTQSLSVDASDDRMIGVDHGIKDAHALYRGASALAGGWLRFDAEIETETRLPESPVVKVGTGLAGTPLDANYQPQDARVGAHRVQAGLDYRHDSSLGAVETQFSYGESHVADLRGFLRADLTDNGSPNADGFNQDRSIRSLYADLHARTVFNPTLALGWGLDWMGGRAAQASVDLSYYVPLDASRRASPSVANPLTGSSGFSDARSDTGLYGQLDFVPSPLTEASLSLRLAHNAEQKTSTAPNGYGPGGAQSAFESAAQTRLNYGISLARRLFAGAPEASRAEVSRAENGSEEIRSDLLQPNDLKSEPGAAREGGAAAVGGGIEARLSYRDTSPPPTPDFGPDYSPTLLRPMQGKRTDASLKGVALGSRLEWTLSGNYLDIRNLILAEQDAYGNPILANAGSAHVRGVDLDTKWALDANRALTLTLAGGVHRATYGATLAVEGDQLTDLTGRDLALSPRHVAAAALAYEPEVGAHGQIALNYVGRRFLDRPNSAPVGGYTTLDVKAGWRRARGGVWLRALNVTDRRLPVAESEFGDSAFYLTPPRTLSLDVYVNWR